MRLAGSRPLRYVLPALPPVWWPGGEWPSGDRGTVAGLPRSNWDSGAGAICSTMAPCQGQPAARLAGGWLYRTSHRWFHGTGVLAIPWAVLATMMLVPCGTIPCSDAMTVFLLSLCGARWWWEDKGLLRPQHRAAPSRRALPSHRRGPWANQDVEVGLHVCVPPAHRARWHPELAPLATRRGCSRAELRTLGGSHLSPRGLDFRDVHGRAPRGAGAGDCRGPLSMCCLHLSATSCPQFPVRWRHEARCWLTAAD